MDLGKIREQIDAIDSQLLELFCRRMDVVKGVAEYKIANDMPVLRPEREQAILERVKAEAGDEYGDYAVDLFENMMRVSREMQQKMIDERK
ncbi:MAG: chorismate mutase [Firmicutes bacterium]|nr:chorismate mutase [Bacillota bacterium]